MLNIGLACDVEDEAADEEAGDGEDAGLGAGVFGHLFGQ